MRAATRERELRDAYLAVAPHPENMTLMSRSEWIVPMVDDFLDEPIPKKQ
jgi:hypothetical protein